MWRIFICATWGKRLLLKLLFLMGPLEYSSRSHQIFTAFQERFSLRKHFSAILLYKLDSKWSFSDCSLSLKTFHKILGEICFHFFIIIEINLFYENKRELEINSMMIWVVNVIASFTALIWIRPNKRKIAFRRRTRLLHISVVKSLRDFHNGILKKLFAYFLLKAI